MNDLQSPLKSLYQGHWFKLICGASNEDLPSIRSLCLAYTLAGADCIDVAADSAVVSAALEGIKAAEQIYVSGAIADYIHYRARPLLMISINDAEDPHFRKAEFDPNQCPINCSRPCERVCPASAISFTPSFQGVLNHVCYGCGRCVPVCPRQIITTRSYLSTPETLLNEYSSKPPTESMNALEIHTRVGDFDNFQRVWERVSPWIYQQDSGSSFWQVLAISCPDGANHIDYLWSLYRLISPLPCPLIWQTDGRPMSGDIGAGASTAAINLALRVLDSGLPGAIQLAGGTNNHTIRRLQEVMKTRDFSSSVSSYIAGVGYGSYARVLLSPILSQLNSIHMTDKNLKYQSQSGLLENHPQLLIKAVDLAFSLVSQSKIRPILV